MRVSIVDYGMGNLASVRAALEVLGATVTFADNPSLVANADRLVLPGVGAFGEGMARLRADGLAAAIQVAAMERGRPLLGICLGMQLLASVGEEGGGSDGLGIVPGRVRNLTSLGCDLRVPHVGWNSVETSASSSLFSGVPQGTDFYFVHSFVLEPETREGVVAEAVHGIRFVAAIQIGNVFGTQFHPEKSSTAGQALLRNFLAA